MDPGDDPGASICGHANRTHYLGGGLYVCFTCWFRTLFGRVRKRSHVITYVM